MSHTHGPEEQRITCDLPTKKACEDRYADWQAMQQVILAYNFAVAGRRIPEDNFLSQLIDYIGGFQRDLMTKEGNPAVSPWAMRIRRAIERFKAGDLPSYNLYRVNRPT